MRLRSLLVLLLLIFPTTLSAVDRWIPIAGTVGNFRTDTRVFNASGEKDIEISAYFLPVGATNNVERIAGAPVKFTVTKRSMRVLDDVVASLFNATGVGAILLTSPDDFLATSRIYAGVATGTLGQFSVADSVGLARTKGVLVQLKSNAANRTNIGAVNVQNTVSNVTWNLYGKTNAKIATVTRPLAAYEVLGPSNIAQFFTIPAGADISDAWVSFQASSPIFAYGSVIDNGTTDPTFIPQQEDTGSDPVVVAPTVKSVTLSMRNFAIDVTGEPLATLTAGDRAKFTVRSVNGTHGLLMVGPTGATVIPDKVYQQGGNASDFEITLVKGTYTYFCTVSTCGVGHGEMSGQIEVK